MRCVLSPHLQVDPGNISPERYSVKELGDSVLGKSDIEIPGQN